MTEMSCHGTLWEKNWAGKLVPTVLHGGKAKILFLGVVVPRILKGQMLGSAILNTVVIMGAIGAMLFGMFVMCAINCCGKNSDIADVDLGIQTNFGPTKARSGVQTNF